MGELQHEACQFAFNGFLKVAFQGSRVTSDAGLLLVRELDERLGLEALISEYLNDSRQGLNTQFSLADLLRESVYSGLAGYEDLNDAVRVSADPTFRLIGSPKRWDRGAALTSTLHWFETELLTHEENLVGLRAVNRELRAQAEMATRADRIVLDMDSSESPVHGAQEGSAYNGHFASVGYHPLFLFNDQGDCLAASLRPGNVPSADDWDDLLMPEIARQQGSGEARGVPGGRGVRPAGDLRGARATRRGLCHSHAGEQDVGVGGRRHPLSSAGTAKLQAVGAVQEFPLPGEELDPRQTDGRQGGAPPG